MVRVYRRKSQKATNYTKAELKHAVDEINRGITTAYAASQKYGIPQSTLSAHRRGIRGIKSKSMGRDRVIPKEDEEKLVQCIQTMEKWGWGLTRSEILNIVGEFVSRSGLKTPFKRGRPGEDWFLGFRKKYNLSIKKPQSVEYARKKSLDSFIISQYFTILKEQMDLLDLHDKPDQIWNLDETNFSLDPSKTKVVGKIGVPCSRTTASSGRENITVLMAANAAGHKAPPLIIFKGRNIWDQWLAPSSETFPGTTYAATANGWMEADVFLKYFEKSFLEAIGLRRPVLLIYDGHVSHIDRRLISLAVDNDVVILKLPPHSSHLLQPLDLSVFKSLKSKWDYLLVKWQRQHQGQKIPKCQFSKLIGEIWTDLSPEVIRNGFQKGGIFPFNNEVISKDQYDPLAYKRWEERNAKDTNLDNGSQVSPIAFQKSSETNQNCEPSTSMSCQTQAEDNQLSEPSTSTFQKQSDNINTSEKTSTSSSQRTSHIFEELLLATVKQSKNDEKKSKRRVVQGAEVITSKEAVSILKDKENVAKERKNKSKKHKSVSSTQKQRKTFSQLQLSESSSDEEVPYNDNSDEDFGDDLVEQESINDYIEAINKSSTNISTGDWVLVLFATKKSKRYYVGQVTTVNKEDDELEVNFLKKLPSLDPSKPSTFIWPAQEDRSSIELNTVVTTLPQPVIVPGRRTLIKFDVDFSSYHIF